ncbi:MAG: calcium-binding protein, partial [Pseudomonadota bacterium]
MRKLTLIAAASVLALGGAGIAVAKHHGKAHDGQGHRGHQAASFEKADANGDGEITLDEAKAHGAERFAKMDADADGALTKADREARAAQRFTEADANGDGELTPDEMTAAREARDSERAERRA